MFPSNCIARHKGDHEISNSGSFTIIVTKTSIMKRMKDLNEVHAFVNKSRSNVYSALLEITKEEVKEYRSIQLASILF